jgi:hypothetical protein
MEDLPVTEENMCMFFTLKFELETYQKSRDRLRGQWGVVDVDDTVACVKQIVKQGLVDEKRVVIRGGSAGESYLRDLIVALTHKDLSRWFHCPRCSHSGT